MNAVSSNYPAATATNYRITLNKGENKGYYKTAKNASELNAVFNDIFKDSTSNPPVPTLVESGKNATNSGYVRFNDPLGDYMTVDGFNAIAFDDEIFKNPTKTTETTTKGTVDTYAVSYTHLTAGQGQNQRICGGHAGKVSVITAAGSRAVAPADEEDLSLIHI